MVPRSHFSHVGYVLVRSERQLSGYVWVRSEWDLENFSTKSFHGAPLHHEIPIEMESEFKNYP